MSAAFSTTTRVAPAEPSGLILIAMIRPALTTSTETNLFWGSTATPLMPTDAGMKDDAGAENGEEHQSLATLLASTFQTESEVSSP